MPQLKLSKAKTEPKGSDLADYAAAFVRGVGAFAPGGLIGAGVGGGTELIAEGLEGRFNPKQIGAQALMGAVPFAKARGLISSIGKGAVMGASGNAITSMAEGENIDLKSLGVSAVLGGVGGGIASRLKLSKAKTSPAPISKPIAEVPKVVTEAKPIKLKKDLRKSPTVKLPSIMSENGPAAGRNILDEIERDRRILASRSISSEIEKGPKVILKQEAIASEIPKVNNLEARSFSDYANIPKAFSASADISFPLRQGIALIGRKEWWKSWKPMMESITSEEGYRNLQKSLASKPKFNEAVSNGLALTDFVKGTLPKGLSIESVKKLAQQEEQFASRVAEAMTGGSYSPIRASNRAYTAFANNLRMTLYEKLSDDIDLRKLENSQVVKKNVADYINTASGRGSMGLRIGEKSETLERGAELLNTVFWSPRFLASRVQLLNPASYTKLDSFTRKQALKDMITAVSSGLGILGIAKLNGAEVDLDPTSSDFAKAKIGNTRVDLTGGFSPIIRFISQAIEGLATEEKGPDPLRFIRSKLSPTAGLIVDLTQGKDYLGKNIEGSKEVGERIGKTFIPMVAQDIYEIYQEDPSLLPLGLVSATGGNIQVYDREENKGAGIKVKLPKLKLSKARN